MSASAAIVAPPDLGAVKDRQQAIWASGDYQMIGPGIAVVSELLIDALDLHVVPGEYHEVAVVRR